MAGGHAEQDVIGREVEVGEEDCLRGAIEGVPVASAIGGYFDHKISATGMDGEGYCRTVDDSVEVFLKDGEVFIEAAAAGEAIFGILQAERAVAGDGICRRRGDTALFHGDDGKIAASDQMVALIDGEEGGVGGEVCLGLERKCGDAKEESQNEGLFHESFLSV